MKPDAVWLAMGDKEIIARLESDVKGPIPRVSRFSRIP